MRRRVLSVTSTDVMWRSLMWWDQCPAECVLCHYGIQGLVSLRRNAMKEARLSTADEAKWFCKWKCNKVFAAYACTSNMFGLFCFSICLQWQTNGIQLWILHKFSVNPIKLWLVSEGRTGVLPLGVLLCLGQMLFLEDPSTIPLWVPQCKSEGVLLQPLHGQSQQPLLLLSAFSHQSYPIPLILSNKTSWGSLS